jgi:hypothetical protein
VLLCQPPRVWQAGRPLLPQRMTIAEPLGRTMAPAAEVTSAALHARQKVPTALHTTQEPAAVHATLEATMEAAAESTEVGPESHLQREMRTA